MVTEYIKKVKLIAVRDGNYTVYVFQDVETFEYIMCTRLPNWKIPDIELGVEGFLQYQIVNAGDEYIVENTYFDASDKSFNTITLENKSQGIIKLKSEVTVKIHEVSINSKEEFEALRQDENMWFVDPFSFIGIIENYDNKPSTNVTVDENGKILITKD